jgi:hypothetical protein
MLVGFLMMVLGIVATLRRLPAHAAVTVSSDDRGAHVDG